MSATISVIIPVFNGARFIADALKSVCEQTHLPTEIVVADDCSTDNTCDIVREFARGAPVPIDLFRMDKNTGGPNIPASLAFARTSGRYVCILDADDLFERDAFETYMAMFAAEPHRKVGVATSDFLTFAHETGETLTPSYFRTQAQHLARVVADDSATGVVLPRDELFKIYAHTFAIPFKSMISRQCWIDLRGPNTIYRHVCDVEFIWRVMAQTDYEIRILNRPLVKVRISEGSLSSQEITQGKEIVALLETMLTEIGDPGLRRVIRGRVEKEWFDVCYAAYKRRNYREFVPAYARYLIRRYRIGR